jgi:hypothetical protein
VKADSLLALMVESFVLDAGSVAGTHCQRIWSNCRSPLTSRNTGESFVGHRLYDGDETNVVGRLLR